MGLRNVVYHGSRMSIAIATLIVVGFLFSVGCCCTACGCTSCTISDDVASAYEVTITGIVDGYCATCSNANATYSLASTTNSFCGNLFSFPGDPVCVYATTEPCVITCAGGAGLGCAGVGANVTCALAITSDGSVSGYDDCERTVNWVYLLGDVGVGCGIHITCTGVGSFVEIAPGLLSCDDGGDYESRNIPQSGGSATGDCDYSGATCTVTRV